MSDSTLRQSVRITNPQGFHLRPKAAFVRLAMKFASEVWVFWDNQRFNGKSILDLMLVAAEQNHEVVVETEGPDAAEALPALVAVLAAASMDDGDPAPDV
jgi:phosphotransferase system HPr (HPr) family protein